MVKGLCFASGVIFGIMLACAACSQGPVYGSGPYGPGAGPPPEAATTEDLRPPAILKSRSNERAAACALRTTDKAANDYHGHKANAIGYIDNALGELQTCMSMP